MEMELNIDYILTKHAAIEVNIRDPEQNVEIKQEIQKSKLNDLPREENSEEPNRKKFCIARLKRKLLGIRK